MEASFHSLENLFMQLGLDNDEAAIQHFIQVNKLAASQKLEEAAFWSSSQADFIREALSEDSDWAEVVDQLNALLHESDD